MVKSMHRHFDGALRQIWEFHVLFFPSPGAVTRHYRRSQNTVLKTIRDSEQGLFIYAASGTQHDAAGARSFAARIRHVGLAGAAEPPRICEDVALNKARFQMSASAVALLLLKLYLPTCAGCTASSSAQQTHKDQTFPQRGHTFHARRSHASPSTGGCHRGASSTCLSSDSSPSCIVHVHV